MVKQSFTSILECFIRKLRSCTFFSCSLSHHEKRTFHRHCIMMYTFQLWLQQFCIAWYNLDPNSLCHKHQNLFPVQAYKKWDNFPRIERYFSYDIHVMWLNGLRNCLHAVFNIYLCLTRLIHISFSLIALSHSFVAQFQAFEKHQFNRNSY